MVEAMRTHVVMPRKLVEEVDAKVGPRGRSQYVVEAVREKLDRERRLALFDEMAGTLKDVNVPGWETSESASQWVRELRSNDRDPWADWTPEDE